MRFNLAMLAGVSLTLAACGDKPAASENGIAADQGFSVENSSANDVTAIDAATADAAGMAADAEANLLLPEADNAGNASANSTANAQ